MKNFLITLFFLIFSLSANERRPMNYEDIVTLSKPETVSLSPNGMHAAFTTRTGDLEANRSICMLYFWNLKENRQACIYEADNIEHIQWKDDTTFYFISQQNERFEIVSYSPKGVVTVTSSVEPICSYTLSSDGQGIYYTLTKKTPKEEVIKLQEEGYTFRWGIDNSFMLVDIWTIYY